MTRSHIKIQVNQYAKQLAREWKLLKTGVGNAEVDTVSTLSWSRALVANRVPVISVLLPAHNEAESIQHIVRSYHEEICENLSAELIVTEDGSTDGTKEILTDLKNELHITLLSNCKRRGYAKGVSDGLRKCRGDWVFFSDSDGQYSASDFWSLWEKRHNFDMIIGAKIPRKDSAYRLALAGGFHKIMNYLFGLSLHDADCGFRLIRKDVLNSVIDEVRFLKYSFWAEFTIRACLKGFKIFEVPIIHNSRAYGKTHIYLPSKIPMIVLRQLKGLANLYSDLKRDN